LKVQGRNLYELAREGVTVDREARNIVIHDLKICHLQDADQAQRFINEHAPSRVPHAYVWDQLISRDLPLLALWVKCSKGTYIRTLGEDIGQALGSCAHLVGLRRVQTGAFDLLNCVPLDDLEKLDSSLRAQQLLPVESLLGGHTRITLDEEDAARFLTGLPRKGNWPDLEEVAVFSKSPHALLGSAYTRAGELIPGRLLNPLEINSILESLS
jgi:tRNA pseudouridine55 synthase